MSKLVKEPNKGMAVVDISVQFAKSYDLKTWYWKPAAPEKLTAAFPFKRLTERGDGASGGKNRKTVPCPRSPPFSVRP